MNKELVTQWVA